MKRLRVLLDCARHPRARLPVLWVAAFTFGAAFLIVLREL